MRELCKMDGCEHLLDQRCATHGWNLGSKSILKVPFFIKVYTGVLDAKRVRRARSRAESAARPQQEEQEEVRDAWLLMSLGDFVLVFMSATGGLFDWAPHEFVFSDWTTKT